MPSKSVQHLKNFQIPDNHGAIPGICHQQLAIRAKCYCYCDTQRGGRGCSCCHRQKRDIFELVYVLCFPSWNPWSCLNPVVCARSKIMFLQTYLGQCVCCCCPDDKMTHFPLICGSSCQWGRGMAKHKGTGPSSCLCLQAGFLQKQGFSLPCSVYRVSGISFVADG